MGAGSSKKVQPEAAFRAADTDKDGKLTPQELGAMLRAKGIAWSPKRIQGLLCAFDENGDGALDLGEFVNGLEQLAVVAGDVLEEQQPSQPAVAGVIAVGSRLDKNNYVEDMAAWARDPQQLLPKAVLLQANMAAVRAIGPAYLQQHLEQQKIDELTRAVEALKKGDVAARTRAEHQLAEAKKRKAKSDAKLAEGFARIHAVMLASAEAISPGLARDGKKYTEALNQLVADEPDVLDEVSTEAAAMVNSGALKVGDEVEVVEGGAMQRAQVRRVVDQADGTYELSLWSEVNFTDTKYEAGFDTSEPKLVMRARRGIYANTKQKQALRPDPDPNPAPNPDPDPNPNNNTDPNPDPNPDLTLSYTLNPFQVLSKEAHALAAGRAAAEAEGAGGSAVKGAPPPPTAPAHLALLYSDAERSLPLLHDLSAEIKTQQPSAVPVVAPLKGEARAAFKTLDKYGGDYSRLTDLARMCAACAPRCPPLARCPALRPDPHLYTWPTSADCVALCVCVCVTGRSSARRSRTSRPCSRCLARTRASRCCSSRTGSCSPSTPV